MENKNKDEGAAPVKGAYGGRCNVTACTTNWPALWYNLSTRMHYCRECAMRINGDVFNRSAAMRIYGSPNLCVLSRDTENMDGEDGDYV